MELILPRRFLTENYTISPLFNGNNYLCDIVEDKVRDFNADGDLLDAGEIKIPKFTAIPYGRSKIILSMSPKFKRVLPLLLDVKHFEGIRIHKGINAGNSSGCLIPGENRIKGGVINSEMWEMKLVQLMLDAIYKGEDIFINIIKFNQL